MRPFRSALSLRTLTRQRASSRSARLADCCLLIEWLLTIAKVFVGLNVTTVAAARPIAEATLEGTALSVFQASMNELLAKRMNERIAAEPNNVDKQRILDLGHNDEGNHLHPMIKDSCRTVLEKSMPRHILARVKRQVRREMCKPKNDESASVLSKPSPSQHGIPTQLAPVQAQTRVANGRVVGCPVVRNS